MTLRHCRVITVRKTAITRPISLIIARPAASSNPSSSNACSNAGPMMATMATRRVQRCT